VSCLIHVANVYTTSGFVDSVSGFCLQLDNTVLKIFPQKILVKKKKVGFACSGTLMNLYLPLTTSTKMHPL
jgi:hypothetical protein